MPPNQAGSWLQPQSPVSNHDSDHGSDHGNRRYDDRHAPPSPRPQEPPRHSRSGSRNHDRRDYDLRDRDYDRRDRRDDYDRRDRRDDYDRHDRRDDDYDRRDRRRDDDYDRRDYDRRDYDRRDNRDRGHRDSDGTRPIEQRRNQLPPNLNARVAKLRVSLDRAQETEQWGRMAGWRLILTKYRTRLSQPTHGPVSGIRIFNWWQTGTLDEIVDALDKIEANTEAFHAGRAPIKF